VAHDLGADLDELLPERRQRPLLDDIGQPSGRWLGRDLLAIIGAEFEGRLGNVGKGPVARSLSPFRRRLPLLRQALRLGELVGRH
jgi:hypothetical protein